LQIFNLKTSSYIFFKVLKKTVCNFCLIVISYSKESYQCRIFIIDLFLAWKNQNLGRKFKNFFWKIIFHFFKIDNNWVGFFILLDKRIKFLRRWISTFLFWSSTRNNIFIMIFIKLLNIFLWKSILSLKICLVYLYIIWSLLLHLLILILISFGFIFDKSFNEVKNIEILDFLIKRILIIVKLCWIFSK
jgi:hypothetical protein